MHCPICNAAGTKVVDSRLTNDGHRVRRRRECLNPACGERFSTYEIAEVLIPVIVKSNNDRESYQPEKLRRGLLRAVEKRPVSEQSINALINSIEQKMRQANTREFSSKQLGEWVMEGLKALDHVAYLRFASVYLSFNDVTAFEKAIAELSQSQRNENSSAKTSN